MNLSSILTNEVSLRTFINSLNTNKGKPLREWLKYARSICHELPSEECLLSILLNELFHFNRSAINWINYSNYRNYNI